MGDNYPDDTSTISTSIAGDMTPTQSELSYENDACEDVTALRRPVDKEYFPSAGKTFVISSREGKVLTVLNGELQATDGYAFGGCWLWKCRSNRNWYEFCNTASGTLLRRSEMQFSASYSGEEVQLETRFAAHRHEDGGYVLLSKYGHELVQMKVGADGKSLIAVEDGGVAWNFIAVDHLAVSE